jgi:hypothetical protein
MRGEDGVPRAAMSFAIKIPKCVACKNPDRGLTSHWSRSLEPRRELAAPNKQDY